MAFAKMLNDFYDADADDTVASPPPPPSAACQAGLEFDLISEAAQTVQSTAGGPWDDIEVNKKMGVTIQVLPELYKKMIWLTQNVPQMSHQKLTRIGLEAEVERLLSQHYRPE